MLRNWLKTIKTVLIAVGVLLSFFAFIEFIRAYQVLRDVHPWCGHAFLVLLAAAIVWLFLRLAGTLLTQPPVLVPPRLGDPDKASARRLKRYAKYLTRYTDRLKTNVALSAEDRQLASGAKRELSRAIDVSGSREELIVAIEQTENECIKPLLDKIDEAAMKHVRTSMRDVMIAVTLSPYKALDLFVVIYRNITMMIRIIHTYQARPRLREQLRIYLDIAAVVATVNYINMGKNLIEGIGSKVPGIGRFVDDIAQGMGAGFMTTIVGHAAMDRCRAFKGWNEQTARVSLRNRVGDFYGDVRDIFKKDVLPSIMKRIGDSSRETVEKIGAALDETGNLVTSFVMAPINVAGKVTSYSRSKLHRLTNIFRFRGTSPD